MYFPKRENYFSLAEVFRELSSLHLLPASISSLDGEIGVLGLGFYHSIEERALARLHIADDKVASRAGRKSMRLRCYLAKSLIGSS